MGCRAAEFILRAPLWGSFLGRLPSVRARPPQGMKSGIADVPYPVALSAATGGPISRSSSSQCDPRAAGSDHRRLNDHGLSEGETDMVRSRFDE